MDLGIARDDTRKYSEMSGNAFGLLFAGYSAA